MYIIEKLDIQIDNYDTELKIGILNKYYHISKKAMISKLILLKQIENTPKGTCSVYQWFDW